MKRLFSVTAAFLALAVVCAPLFAGGQQGGGGAAAPAKAVVWKLGDNQPDGYPTVLGDLAMAKYVEEKTKGAIKIEVYNNSVLGTEKDMIEQLQTGDIQFMRVGINPLSSLNPQVNVLGMPFLFRDREHMFKVLDGPIGEEVLGYLKNQNILGLCWLDAGFRNFYNRVREIKTPADMKGLRIRVQESNLMMNMIKYLGASPTPMAYGEVYPSIQNGVIDGAENNWPSYITAAHVEVAKYFTVDGHMASPEMILINYELWNRLTPELQKIVKDGAMEGAKVERAEWIKAEQKYEAEAKAKGTIVTVPTPEQHKLFEDALAPLYNEPDYAGFKDIVARIRAVK
jgi:tripartite ATP-independent transporter DctP family solute receptor